MSLQEQARSEVCGGGIQVATDWQSLPELNQIWDDDTGNIKGLQARNKMCCFWNESMQ